MAPAASNWWPFVSPPQQSDANQLPPPTSHQLSTQTLLAAGRRAPPLTTSLGRNNNEFQQPGRALYTLWPLFKHVLIMSHLCKHILTLYSALCDCNLAVKREAPVPHKDISSLSAGGEVTKRWMGNQELLKPSLYGRGVKGIKSL